MKKHLKIATLVALIGSGIDVALKLWFLAVRIRAVRIRYGYFDWVQPLYLIFPICIFVFFLVLFLAQSKRN